MKIATFNINNINKRLPNLLDWLRAAKPDIVCLQELKAADDQFPKIEIEKAGYGAVWRGDVARRATLESAREPVSSSITNHRPNAIHLVRPRHLIRFTA